MASLSHEYDPVKRREYYLKNRKLVGRAKKGVPAKVGGTVARKTPAKKTHSQRQKELEARVSRLQAKFQQLQTLLKAVIEAAQKRSGVDKNSTEDAAEKKYQSAKKSDPESKYEKKTQKQKDAAAEAAQKYRDKNNVLEDQVKDLNDKIKAIRERIKRIQKTGSVGASKTTTR